MRWKESRTTSPRDPQCVDEVCRPFSLFGKGQDRAGTAGVEQPRGRFPEVQHVRSSRARGWSLEIGTLVGLVWCFPCCMAPPAAQPSSKVLSAAPLPHPTPSSSSSSGAIALILPWSFSLRLARSPSSSRCILCWGQSRCARRALQTDGREDDEKEKSVSLIHNQRGVGETINIDW